MRIIAIISWPLLLLPSATTVTAARSRRRAGGGNVRADDGGGGWADPPLNRAGARAFLPEPFLGVDDTSSTRSCPFNRFSAASFTISKFRQLENTEPFIITNATEGWRATRAWRKSDFLARYGGITVDVGSSAEVLAYGDSAAQSVLLADLVGSFGEQGSAEDLFVFDSMSDLFDSHRGGFQSRPPPLPAYSSMPAGVNESRGVLARDFETPAWARFFLSQGASVGWNMLSLADDSHGLGFHNHGKSWLALVYGSKQWWVYPPGGVPAALSRLMQPLHSVSEWLPDALLTLPNHELPISCLQSPGEILYLPAGWVHATMNVGETIGVGGQAAQVREQLEELALAPGGDAFVHKAKAALVNDSASKVQHYRKASALCPQDVELLAKLFEALLETPNIDDVRPSDTVVEAKATLNNAIDLVLSAADTGASDRTIAAYMHRIGKAMMDAVMAEALPLKYLHNARKLFDNALTLTMRQIPAGPMRVQANVLLHLGQVCAVIGEWEDAVKYLRRAEGIRGSAFREQESGPTVGELIAEAEMRGGDRGL
jgi:hypothetical protein